MAVCAADRHGGPVGVARRPQVVAIDPACGVGAEPVDGRRHAATRVEARPTRHGGRRPGISAWIGPGGMLPRRTRTSRIDSRASTRAHVRAGVDVAVRLRHQPTPRAALARVGGVGVVAPGVAIHAARARGDPVTRARARPSRTGARSRPARSVTVGLFSIRSMRLASASAVDASAPRWRVPAPRSGPGGPHPA